MKIKAELMFPAKLKDEPILCYLCKKFDIIMNIVEASFSTEVGWAIIIFEGKEGEVKNSLDYLKNNNIEIKNLQTL